jgi:tryptophan-rich sensory protein
MVLKIIKLFIAIVVTQLAGFIGSLFAAPNIATWYNSLAKPSFTPPSWLFAPVWTLLYLSMGISLYLVWIKKADKLAFSLFFIQLFLNILWSVLFFGLQNTLVGLIEIIVLWAAILATILYFYRISKAAALILIPYLAWVSFAAVLNFSIHTLNYVL